MRPVALLCGWLGGALAFGAGLLALYVVVAWLRLPDPSAVPATGDPGPTRFMAGDGCDDHARTYRPLDDIDPRLVCTVIWSEDWQFFHHDGVDRDSLRRAVERNWRARAWRLGASTITMQLARNLFLSRARTPSRKAREVAIALDLDAALGKRRVLELYLNAAELAPCTYGVDAAAHHYFGHGAGEVDLAEAAFLASMLPRPAQPPGATAADRDRLIRHQQRLLKRVARSGLASLDEFHAAQRRILDNWADGWRRPPLAPRPAGWDRAIEVACGAQKFRDSGQKE